MDVSEQKLVKQIHTMFHESDPASLTCLTDVVQKLESQLRCNLSHERNFIRHQLNLVLIGSRPNDRFAPDTFIVSRDQPMVLKVEPDMQDEDIKDSALPKRYQFVNPTQQMVFKAEADSKDAEIKGSHAAKSVPAKKRGRAGGLNEVCSVTPELQVIVGQPALPRTEIVKRLWAYIRRNSLQYPGDRKKIICDDALHAVFEVDCTDMFKMNKLLSKHIIRLEPPKQEENTSQAKTLKIESVDGSGWLTRNLDLDSILIMSKALAHFLGTKEKEISKAEVLRRLWDYTTLNELEDPTNKSVILCDDKLQQLLGRKKVFAWEVPGMIDHHLFKRS